jgi:hypothetical protein
MLTRDFLFFLKLHFLVKKCFLKLALPETLIWGHSLNHNLPILISDKSRIQRKKERERERGRRRERERERERERLAGGEKIH